MAGFLTDEEEGSIMACVPNDHGRVRKKATLMEC